MRQNKLDFGRLPTGARWQKFLLKRNAPAETGIFLYCRPE
ncbi:MAG: hypothetical protein AVDCRST_MAG95-1626 [uncultured Adhaeribacter sp.]|uniref:Uncharacterized protein n=1 Tax=uncultured Adhaeribacter sp. TaxID=448109 RepID=A0A6J4I8Y2_9BACT|nr:MAG: hypothetical protein AVDCRST_MAG95-1626 [uncultured Adhaeribacter sp.]